MDTTNNLTYNNRYDRSVRPLPKGSLPLLEYYWYPGWDSNPRYRLRQKRTLSTELPELIYIKNAAMLMDLSISPRRTRKFTGFRNWLLILV